MTTWLRGFAGDVVLRAVAALRRVFLAPLPLAAQMRRLWCLILTRAHGERVLYVSMCTGAASVEVCARPCSSVLETACDVERQKVCMCV